MKNILVITTSRDNLGSHTAYISDINLIQDITVRTMIENTIDDINWELNGYWVSHGMCGHDRGYIFYDWTLFDKQLPITIDHIVNCAI